MYRLVLPILCALLPSMAMANQPTLPSIEVPSELEPYARTKDVLASARKVISLLGSGKVTMQYGKEAAEQCKAEGVASIYRGMAIAQTGYNMFVNKMEINRYSVDKVLDLGNEPNLKSRYFTRPGRVALMSSWQPAQLKELLGVAQAFQRIEIPMRTDIVSFLRYLEDVRLKFDKAMESKSADLLFLHRRSQGEYWHRYYDARRRDEQSAYPDSKGFEKKWPEPIYYDNESFAYRELIDSARDVGDVRMDPCFDGKEVGVSAITLGATGSEVVKQRYGIHPTAYAVGFWVRRHKEGTANLAKFVIDYLVDFINAK